MLWDVVETQCHCPSVATVWNADKARSPVVFYSGTTDGDILAVVDVQNCFLKVAGWERRGKEIITNAEMFSHNKEKGRER